MTKSIYLLIHGAWHGSWSWHKVAPMLQGRGHTVLTPDLPGHFSHKVAFQNISLKTYVDHIVDIVDSCKVPPILVGHSMAGVVISQVAELMPQKIDRLIYISGFIPQNGGSLLDEEKQASIPTVGKIVQVDVEEMSIGLPLENPTLIVQLFYGFCSRSDKDFAMAHLQKQPLKPFLDPIHISNNAFGRVPKTYIECLQDQAIMISDQRRMHSKIKCQVETMDTDYSPFFSAPQQLVKLLTKNIEVQYL